MRKITCLSLIGVLIFGTAGLAFAMMGMRGAHGSNAEGHSGHAEAAEVASPVQTAVEDVGNKICPVTGEKIAEKGKVTYEYKGKAYNFCCPMCIDEFKKDPEKYIAKIKGQETKEGQVAK